MPNSAPHLDSALIGHRSQTTVRASKLGSGYETWVLETVRTRGRNGGPLRGEPTLLAEPRQVYAFRNVILDPVGVPPFLRVDLHAIELHGKLGVIEYVGRGLAE
jgi:hypothetical protein